MDVLLSHVAGIDVHKEILAITVLIGGPGEKVKVEQFTCSTFTGDLEETAQRLLKAGVQDVAMESTGIYWKPIFNVFHAAGIRVTLGNAAHIKNVPGRKTDMKDSHWIAYLHRHGFIKASFIPEEEFQDLRLLTRHRTGLIEEKTRLKNRVQKILEDGNVKLSCVINDIFGVGGRAVLELIAKGTTDAKILSEAVKTNVKKKDDLIKGLKNCLRQTHIVLIRELLEQVEFCETRIGAIDAEISERVKKHADVVSRLCEVPGVSENLAVQIVSESGASLASFGEDRKYAAWAGVAPGNNESAKKKEGLRLEREIQR